MAPNMLTSVTANGTMGEQQRKASSRAFVTFLAGNGDYIKGVVGLAKGLRKTKTIYPLVVAVLPDVPQEHRNILKSQGCIVREIEPVYPPENQTQFAMAYYVINYSKLRIWEFVEYNKMIYLDGDIQVFANIDHLFDLPDNYFYAVMDCFCERSHGVKPLSTKLVIANNVLIGFNGNLSLVLSLLSILTLACLFMSLICLLIMTFSKHANKLSQLLLLSRIF